MSGHPEDKRQTRVWNHLQEGEVFFPIREWPEWARIVMLKTPAARTRTERYSLFHFFVMNGLDPGLAADVSMLYDYQHQHGSMDPTHRRHIKEMQGVMEGGGPAKQAFIAGKRVYDMIQRRPQ